jgi:hypothetical protein
MVMVLDLISEFKKNLIGSFMDPALRVCDPLHLPELVTFLGESQIIIGSAQNTMVVSDSATRTNTSELYRCIILLRVVIDLEDEKKKMTPQRFFLFVLLGRR